MSLDLLIFNWVHNLAGKSRLLDFIGVFFADYFQYFVVLAALVAIFSLDLPKKRFHLLLLTALTILLSRGIFTELIRFFFYRPRPYVVLGFEPLVDHNSAAFPSGHAAFFFALAFAFYWTDKKIFRNLVICACLISLARVFAGAHWPADILGGVLVAYLAVFSAKELIGAFYKSGDAPPKVSLPQS